MTMSASNNPAGALAGVRILDMATVLAAPMGATLCADHGAEVVKLELPDGSDALRGLQPVKDGVPLWWKVGNRGKKGITLDVRQPRGREILLSMLARFDVLVENFRTGTMDRWGLDIEALHRANPRLVVVRLTGFGQSGPYKARPGYARVFEAMSGFTNLTGEAGGPPLHSNFPVGDAVAGVFCAFAIASEMARLRGNPEALGREVDLAATEALIRVLDPCRSSTSNWAWFAATKAIGRATQRLRTCISAAMACIFHWWPHRIPFSEDCARRSDNRSWRQTRCFSPIRLVSRTWPRWMNG